MKRLLAAALFPLLATAALTACQKEESAQAPVTAPAPATAPATAPAPATTAEANPATTPAGVPAAAPAVPPYADATNQPPPPTPPIKEDFDGEPKLSLFARIGDFAPEENEAEKLGYWKTFIDHLLRTSGPIKMEGGRAFAMRGIKTLNSVGFFSPLAVEPGREYRVSYRLWCKLPQQATTGIGYQEYSQFLWIGEQYSKSISKEYFRGAREGLRLSGKQEGKLQQFTFRSGPETRMVHLILFLEGEPDREPVIVDDIEIVPVASR